MKVIEMPRSLHDPCACHDVYGEVGVLQHLAATGDAAAASTCRLLDFGVGSDAYYITMPLYRASLRQWRVRHGELNSAVPLARRLPLYMRIYEATLAAVAAVSAAGVVHFDLKCDNILLEAREGRSRCGERAARPSRERSNGLMGKRTVRGNLVNMVATEREEGSWVSELRTLAL